MPGKMRLAIFLQSFEMLGPFHGFQCESTLFRSFVSSRTQRNLAIADSDGRVDDRDGLLQAAVTFFRVRVGQSIKNRG